MKTARWIWVCLLLSACGGDRVLDRSARPGQVDEGADARPEDRSDAQAVRDGYEDAPGGADGMGTGGAWSPDSLSPDALLADAEAPPLDVCDGVVATPAHALSFDGDTRVAMGNAPNLGLERFTLAAWVRRSARGIESGTGAGGLTLTPLITKGRGEKDGSNVDCNYAFGFFGDVLGADFEDMASGANHPVFGKTRVRQGEWHHVAATYDGATWRLYLDGKLDAERTVNATPRFDSIQHFGLGAAWNSLGVAKGGFVGDMAEVQVYNRALGRDEIVEQMSGSTPDLRGLVAHYPLDAADARAGQVRDRISNSHGTLTGGAWHTDGPLLDQGARPVVLSASSSAHTLTVEASDADGDPLMVDFYTRELRDADDFTIVVLPDTQYYTRDASPPKRPKADNVDYFKAQTRWAMQNIESKNVIGLIHNGDIINNSPVRAQWQRADAAMALLDAPTTRFPAGLPYGMSYGNHDQDPKDEPGATATANQWFGTARFGARPWFGGSFKSGKADETWVQMKAGDLDVIVVNMQFNPEPDEKVLDWMREVFQSRPNAFGIINTHYILTGKGNFSAQGKAIYQKVKDLPNVWLMTSGHVAHASRRTEVFQGNPIHAMLADYQKTKPDPADPQRPLVTDQGLTNGGHGYMRIWRLSPRQQKVFVTSYSPKLNQWYTNDDNQFSLDIDLVGAGTAAFTRVASVPLDQGRAQVPAGLASGARAEWYAVVRDCVHEVTTEVARVD